MKKKEAYPCVGENKIKKKNQRTVAIQKGDTDNWTDL